MIHVTSPAAQAILRLVSEKNATTPLGLRLSIERGGCAGLQYAMNIGSKEESETIIEHEDAKIFIDAKSCEQLDGCTLDYEEGLTGAGFRIINPHAARSCGCGTSFEPKKDIS